MNTVGKWLSLTNDVVVAMTIATTLIVLILALTIGIAGYNCWAIWINPCHGLSGQYLELCLQNIN